MVLANELRDKKFFHSFQDIPGVDWLGAPKTTRNFHFCFSSACPPHRLRLSMPSFSSQPWKTGRSWENTWRKSREPSNWSWAVGGGQPCEKRLRSSGAQWQNPRKFEAGPTTLRSAHSRWRTQAPGTWAASGGRERSRVFAAPVAKCRWTAKWRRRTSMARAQWPVRTSIEWRSRLRGRLGWRSRSFGGRSKLWFYWRWERRVGEVAIWKQKRLQGQWWVRICCQQ